MSREGRVDQHQPGDIGWEAVGVEGGVEAAHRVTYEHDRRVDARLPQQRMQIVRHLRPGDGRAWWAAEAKPGSIVEARTCHSRDRRLDRSPVDHRALRALLEDDGRRAVAGADDVEAPTAGDADEVRLRQIGPCGRPVRRE